MFFDAGLVARTPNKLVKGLSVPFLKSYKLVNNVGDVVLRSKNDIIINGDTYENTCCWWNQY